MLNNSNKLNILCLGDIVGRPGRNSVRELLPELKNKLNIQLVVANGENAAGGMGPDTKTALELKSAGIDMITLGDHTWQHKEFFPYLDKHPEHCIRPANYPADCPGRGWSIIEIDNYKIGFLNIIGRIFTTQIADCPFSIAENILSNELKECNVVICDIHAEATSEKLAFAQYFRGKMSLIFGTHTHVQTADEQIIDGTAYITDLGMCGCTEGVIGMDKEVSIARFRTGIPYSYKLAKGPAAISGIYCSIDCDSGKALHIERIYMPYNDTE